MPRELTVLIEISDELAAQIRKLEREMGKLEAEIRKLAPDEAEEQGKVVDILDHIDEIGKLIWDIGSKADDIRIEAM